MAAHLRKQVVDVAVARLQPLRQRLAAQVVVGVGTGQAREGGIGDPHPPLRVADDDAVGRALHQRHKLGGGLVALVGRINRGGPHQQQQRAVGAKRRGAQARGDPPPGQAHAHLACAAGGAGRAEHLLHRRARGAVQADGHPLASHLVGG